MTGSVLYMSLRINRYIVGCKSIKYKVDSVGEYRINRYIVGCK